MIGRRKRYEEEEEEEEEQQEEKEEEKNEVLFIYSFSPVDDLVVYLPSSFSSSRLCWFLTFRKLPC
jgi:negative regulator of genetic competence, sporulation and motility